MKFNVNHNAVVIQTNRLEKLHRSALPVAIRETLNNAAFDVKKNTMPKTAKEFKKRKPNFFRANSKVEKANGFDTKSMKAVVGFYENKLANASTNFAVKDLEQQELGGVIKKKTFIAQKGARVNNKMVRQNFRLNVLHSKIIKASSNGKDSKGNSIRVKSKKQQFIRAAIYAESKYGKDAFVLGGRSANGSRTLSLINEIRFSGRYTKGKYNLELSRTPIYSVKKGRVIGVKATNFMKRASLESGAKMSEFYIQQAQRQFIKYAK